MWWQILVGIIAGLALVYLVLAGVLWHTYRRDANMSLLRESLRLLPDLIRLLRRLAADPSLPRGVRIRLGLLIVYLASPIDLIPDFIPVLGYADDALIVAIALRSVTRHAGPQAIDRHWPGTPDGLRVIHRLAGTRAS
jgi:uncharacterized membrane protein YkvA (DUF1232 family)